MILYNITLFC